MPVSVLAAGCAEEKQLFLEMWIRSRRAPSFCHLWDLLVLVFWDRCLIVQQPCSAGCRQWELRPLSAAALGVDWKITEVK